MYRIIFKFLKKFAILILLVSVYYNIYKLTIQRSLSEHKMGAACCGDHPQTPELVIDKPTEQPKREKDNLFQLMLVLKIQSAFRGYMARKRVKLIRNENQFASMRHERGDA